MRNMGRAGGRRVGADRQKIRWRRRDLEVVKDAKGVAEGFTVRRQAREGYGVPIEMDV